MRENKSLVLFTSSYPYGGSETFLETEIVYLSRRFSKVFIIPNAIGGNMRTIPSNVRVTEDISIRDYDRGSVIKLYGWQIFKMLSSELLKGHLLHKDSNYTVSSLLRIFDRSRHIEDWISSFDIKEREDMIFYSYWFAEWSTLLSILVARGVIEGYVARAHGFDLYEERSKYGYIPFREFQLKHINRLILISKDGFEYMTRKYPKHRDRYLIHRLGTEDKGTNQFENKESIVLLSVSNLVPVKRVEMIVEVLSQVQSKVKWIHFGIGRMFDEVKRQTASLPKNIECDMRGQVSNSDIYRFLQNNSIDLFINLSSSEGIPVSIMEAISFGIPVVATDVGGTSEIVGKQTGVLIEKNFEIDTVADLIEDFKSTHLYAEEFRIGVKEFWRENYCAETNYEGFVDDLFKVTRDNIG